MLGRIGGKLVQDKTQGLHRRGRQRDFRSLHRDLPRVDSTERRKLHPQQFLQGRALPVMLHQEIVTVGERLNAAAETNLEVIDVV